MPCALRSRAFYRVQGKMPLNLAHGKIGIYRVFWIWHTSNIHFDVSFFLSTTNRVLSCVFLTDNKLIRFFFSFHTKHFHNLFHTTSDEEKLYIKNVYHEKIYKFTKEVLLKFQSKYMFLLNIEGTFVKQTVAIFIFYILNFFYSSQHVVIHFCVCFPYITY
jgi:hypothetical protein